MEQSENTAKASIKDAIALAVTAYFAQSNAKDTVYSTADGFLFENSGFATNHASTLEDKNVIPHGIANDFEVVDPEVVARQNSELSTEQLELLNNGLVKENYNQLKQLANYLKLEHADNKADTIIKALTTYKESL